MSAELIAEVARELREAYDGGDYLAPVRTRLPEGDVEAAYAVQRANTEHWIEAGRRVAGCKIGLTSKSVQKQLGVDQPDFGMLFADMGSGDGEEMPWRHLQQPRCEAEVALVLERDLCDAERIGIPELIGAVAYALPAIEVVGSRIAKWDIRIVDTIADNASASRFVLGTTPMKLDGLDLRLAGMVMERRGEPVSFGAGAACLGHPLNAAVWLARTMARRGLPLRAGDTVLTGALGPMVGADPGDVFEARIEGLGSVRAVFGRKEQQT